MKVRPRTLTGRRRTVAAVLAATVVLGGAGATTAVAFAEDGDHDGAPAVAAGSDRDDDRDSVLLKGAEVDLKQAAARATKSVAGTVTAAELEGSRGKPVWHVDVVDSRGTEHEVTVDAGTGKVTKAGTDRDDDGDDAALAKSAGTGVARAVDAALAAVDGTATSAELDDDHGRSAAWHVDVTDTRSTEHEVTVDAGTGKVTATETDDDHDED
ncbi:PepSY domain-containing protein [Streptomyces bangladeshensis]|uniref:PepSY domain-containing protein n=1 Tax=Streptomyces bangladeshensis TaxID=295352 RepID=A0ABN3BFG5_9ACTN